GVAAAPPVRDTHAARREEGGPRLYTHYGIQYTTEESSSGLPVGATASGDGGPSPAADAPTELPPPSRLQADVPATAGVGAGTGPTIGAGQTTATPAARTSWSGGATRAAHSGRKGRGAPA